MDVLDSKLYRTLSRLKRGELIGPLQRGLKDTERKPLGHLYPRCNEFHSSEPHTSVNMDRYYGNRCCYRSNRFIGQLENSSVEYQMYGHLASLRRGLLTPPVITVHYLYSDFRAHK